MQQIAGSLNDKTLNRDSSATSEWSFERVDRTRPLRDQIYYLIRTQILTGALPPGKTLDEKAISSQLGVSRTPVREAVQRLSDENLIEIKPQSRTLIAPVSRATIHQAFLIRRALELETVSSAARSITQRDEARLESNYLEHRLAIEHEEYVVAISLDDDFHSMIADIAKLPLLWRAVTIFKAQLDRCRYQTVPQEGYGEATLQQHRAIIDALKDRNPELAGTMMKSHLDRTYAGITEFLDQLEAG